MGDPAHSYERAMRLHAIRWVKADNDAARQRLADMSGRQLLIGIMDAIFKIEAGLSELGSVDGLRAAEAHFRNALNDLCVLVEDPNNIIDVEG